MNVYELETPCLILDIQKVQRNIQTLHERLKHLKVNLRPHAKTAKNYAVIQMALEGQAGGITVSTVKEAEYFFHHGITDMIYAVGIAPSKLDRIIHLIKQGTLIRVLVDSIDQVQFVAKKAQQCSVTIPILIELDCDGQRSGVTIDNPSILEIGGLIDRTPGVALHGVLTHAGKSYKCKSIEEMCSIAYRERDVAVTAAALLRKNGLPCPIVSIGSTPTVQFTKDLSEITEVRAGVFVFYDLVMAGLGVCTVNDIAISVLASVIGHQKDKGWIITDAGWMALSSDRGTFSQHNDQGYGIVCTITGEPLHDMIISSTSQEHGIVQSKTNRALDWNLFKIGSMLRILPNHACATAAMHEKYHVINNTIDVVTVWNRINNWYT